MADWWDEPVAKQMSPWQRFKNSLTEGMVHSNLGYAAIERAYRRRFLGQTDEEVNRDFRRISETAARRREIDDRYFEDVDTISPANIGKWTVDILGNMIGGADPTYALAPGASAGARIVSQGAINAGVDAINQGIEVKKNIRDEYDPRQTALNAGAGLLFQGLGEAVTKAKVTSGFGRRKAPKAGASTSHGGVDIGVPVGTPIQSPAGGRVTAVGRGHGKRGNWVEIDHGGGLVSRYFHLAGFAVKPGDELRPGQLFGRSGKSGNVTGAHLHWSVLKDGKPVDPMTVRFEGGEPGPARPMEPEEIARVMDDSEAIDFNIMAPEEVAGIRDDLIARADDSDNVIPFEQAAFNAEVKKYGYERAVARAFDEEADVLTPAERQDMDASVDPRKIPNLDNYHEKFTPNLRPLTPANDTKETKRSLGSLMKDLWKDESGTVRVFHGTTKDIQGPLRPSDYSGKLGKGFYVTTDPKYASVYATRPREVTSGANVRPFNVDESKIFGFKQIDGWTHAELRAAAEELGFSGRGFESDIRQNFLNDEAYQRFLKSSKINSGSVIRLLQNRVGKDRLNELLERRGYIGIAGNMSGNKEINIFQPNRSLSSIFKDMLKDESGSLNLGGGPKGPDGEGPKPRPKSKFAGSIDLDRIVAKEDVKNSVRNMAKDSDVAPESHSEWVLEAQSMIDEFGISDLLTMKEIAPERLPAYSYAIRATHLAAQKRYVEIAKAVLDPELSTPALRDALMNARVIAAAAFEKANGIAGVAGKLLNAHKMLVGKGKIIRDVNKRLEQMIGNDVDPVRLAELVVQHAEDGEEALGKLASESLKPRAEDYIFSLWFNFMLSGIKTHVANITGNGSHILLDLLDHGAASVVGKMRGGAERIIGRELAARIHGMKAGALQGFRNAKTAFEVGTPLDMVDKLNHPRVMKGPAKILETPSRALAAEDEFFRNVATLAQVYGLAVRKAHAEGLRGDELAERAEFLSVNPTDKMLRDAIDYARRMRFNDQPTRIAAGLETMRRKVDGDTLGGRLANIGIHAIVPFVRVLDRLTMATVRHLPIIGMLDRVNAADWKAGGARRDLVIGRMTTGAGLLSLVYGWAASDDDTIGITGKGPTNWRRRAELEATGWQPYSIRIGDSYYSYNNIQPISTIFGVAATEIEQLREGGHDDDSWDKTAMRHLSNVTSALTNGNFVTSLAGFFDATGDPSGNQMQNWLANLASSMTVPAIVRQVNQTYIDPALRSTTGDGSIGDRIAGRIKAGIPGMSDDLPQRYDVFGQPIVREGALGPDIASPVTVREKKDDPVIEEVRRLNDTGKALVGPPSNRVKVDGEERKLTDREFQSYQKLSGELFMEKMNELMDFDWDNMEDEEKRAVITKTVKAARKEARSTLFENTDNWWDQ